MALAFPFNPFEVEVCSSGSAASSAGRSQMASVGVGDHRQQQQQQPPPQQQRQYYPDDADYYDQQVLDMRRQLGCAVDFEDFAGRSVAFFRRNGFRCEVRLDGGRGGGHPCVRARVVV